MVHPSPSYWKLIGLSVGVKMFTTFHEWEGEVGNQEQG